MKFTVIKPWFSSVTMTISLNELMAAAMSER